MKELHTQMDKHGRLLIPSQIRNYMNYKSGDTFIIRANDNELHIISLSRVIKEAQNLLKLHGNNSSSLSMTDEFLEQKYSEADKENKIL